LTINPIHILNALHDLPLLGMKLDFEKKQLILLCEEVDDPKNEFVPLEIIFEGLGCFEFSYPQEEYPFEIEAIDRIESKQLSNNQIVSLFCLEIKNPKTGLSSAVGQLKISYFSLELKGGIEAEQRMQKWNVD
jgi:hypothetical protein